MQWNCQGLKANINELLLLLTQECPSIICLRETFTKKMTTLISGTMRCLITPMIPEAGLLEEYRF